MRKGLIEWLRIENPDIFLVQETKARPEQVDLDAFTKLGYHAYFHSAAKAGYSGVAIFSKQIPDRIEQGCGNAAYDAEGRVIRADFGNLTVVSAYFPSGSRSEHRQAFKMQFLTVFQNYIENLRISRPNLVVSGDYNICHKAIDIHNPVANKNTSGFLPEEREWVSGFVRKGFVDSFRVFHPEPGKYSWWTYRANARARNLGWRIDYHFATKELEPNLLHADILNQACHSDHCPTLLELKI